MYSNPIYSYKFLLTICHYKLGLACPSISIIPSSDFNQDRFQVDVRKSIQLQLHVDMDVMLIVRTFWLISDLPRSQDGSSTSGSLGQEGTVLRVPILFPWVDTILHLHYRLFIFLWLSCVAQPLKSTLSVGVLVSYLKYFYQSP